MKEFVHLNVHTGYSLLEGACRLRPLVEKAKSLGQTALAVTDTGALYGAIDFYDACKENGIKPVIGCEIMLADEIRRGRSDSEPYRLTLLCENERGYKNLCRIISGQSPANGKFAADRELIARHSGGLIALSGKCEIPSLLLQNRTEEAKRAACQYLDIFGDGFYLELCNHGTNEEALLCSRLRALSEETGVLTCPTNNVHYVEKGDSYVQRILSCIGSDRRISEPDPTALPTEEYYLKSYDEMRRFFTEEELARTVEIAERCDFEFEFGVTKLPLFTKEGVSDNTQYFEKMCRNGAEKRYGTVTEKIKSRLDYELSVIEKMGFVDYFLIVWDFVRYAKSNGIPVGPGRGSGAGSLCAYCMGITDIDPLRFNLLFERFLNPERVSMPDFDIDFCNERRGEVIEYVRRKYGSSRVAQIVAFDTLKARAAIRDAGRVMGISARAVDSAAKAVVSFNATLSGELEKGELKELYNSDPEIRRVVDAAVKIEGFPRHTTVHAAGVLITREDAAEYVPLQYEDGGLTTQYTMTALERLGLLKMDFLGLRNLTVIKKTCDLIRRKEPDFDIGKIDESDPDTYGMLGNGGTCGVFQFESDGITSVLSRLQPQSLEDLTAALALYRPGPMASIPTYIENRHKSSAEICYKHPLLKEILEVTYGCIVYQEQVMQICRVVGGYSYGRADLVRRAMAKKKHEVMEKERSAFVYGTESNCGAIANGVSEETANDIFDEMSQFASYAFNKSHAAAYAEVAYQTAYLKRHYCLEYMTELISSVLGWTDKMAEYIAELSKNGIRLLPPDVNRSFADFSVEGNAVRFGLAAVKGLGRNFVGSVAEEREKGAFASAADFALRMAGKDNNERYMDALIRCGAFDSLHKNRRQLLESKRALLDYAAREYDRRESGQLDLFGNEETAEFSYPGVENFTPVQLLNMEKDIMGMYVSAHPADVYLSRATEDCAFISDVLTLNNGARTSVMAMITGFRRFDSKRGEMAFADFEDSTGSMSAVVFSETLNRIGRLAVGKTYLIRGKISIKDGQRSIAVESAENAERLTERPRRTLYVNLDSESDSRVSAVTAALFGFKGISKARVCFSDRRISKSVNGLLGVSICPQLLNRLKKLVGEENVRVIEEK